MRWLPGRVVAVPLVVMVVLGMGGYITFPGGLVSKILYVILQKIQFQI